MKVKRVKTARRHLAFFRHHFGLREPFQVLVDGNFCHAALLYKIHIKEQLPKILTAGCTLLVTPCVVEELRKLGNDFGGALFIAKRFEMRRCGHRDPVSAADCLASMVAHHNPNNYLVATQDSGLRARLRQAGSVLLIYLQLNTLLLEPPSEMTLRRAKELERLKLLPNRLEIKAVERMERPPVGPEPAEGTAALTETADSDGDRQLPARPRKRLRGPNPLSVKKSKKKQPEAAPVRASLSTKPAKATTAASASDVPKAAPPSAAGKKRRRGSRGGKRHTKDAAGEDGAAGPSTDEGGPPSETDR